MKARVHAIAGALGLLMILTFWLSTLLSEIFGSAETVATVKGAVLWGMFILIPAMVIVGASGTSLGKTRSGALVSAKKKRMPFIAANGLLILVPMAFILENKAAAGAFDTLFYLLQGIELIAGATNLTLMGLNMRDGIRLRGKAQLGASAKVTASEILAENTLALHLTKPADFSHRPGQWLRLTLPTTGESRILSIVSAPHEPVLTLATRISDSTFKRALMKLSAGAELGITQASGHFTLQEDVSRPAVFIAGGIGITPFMSMIRTAAKTASVQKIILFYANRTASSAAFLSELQDLANTNPSFDLVATLTAPKDDTTAGTGETGKVDHEMLMRHLPDLAAPIYYCVGPTAMVRATRQTLLAAGICEADMVFETFTGY
ncbi:ferredoxin--NADP reductase [Phaeobacter sp. 11ANDIMAR09]|uniref:ferredoxin--NADP reductase n=1 Tax=Phaeobacter sp. 11ANDIMAR09 TaxID=1225647 RepID=UPI0006C8BC4E|nr:FAD-dependent oxidoreductase [Phaeobacter sp. 11ANDIMAR09]